MKKNISIILSLLSVCPSLLIAAPKIATLDLTKIIKKSQGAKDNATAFSTAREELLKNPRKLALDEIAKKIQDLRTKMQEAKEGSDEHKRLIKEGEEQTNAYNDLNRQWQSFLTEQSGTITEELIDSTNEESQSILKIAREIGSAQGFDWIIETSGHSNSKMPVVLYLRESTDITDLVIEELAKKNPPAEPSE